MLVYIVEDDALKAEQLSAFLRERRSSPEIKVCGSYHSGLQAIQERQPNLVILDMTIPTYDVAPNARQGRPRSLGGYDFLRKLRLRSLIVPVIVVTQLETFGEGDTTHTLVELTERCLREFPDQFIGSVFYSPTATAWVSRLSELLKTSEGK